MPRSFGLLLTAVAALLAREASHGVVTWQVERALINQRPLGDIENAIVAADHWLLLWYPFAVIPFLLAPPVAVVAWVVRARRSTHATGSAGLIQGQLRVWLLALVLAGVFLLLAVVIPFWTPSWATTVMLAAILAFSWATAGGLFAALSLQRHRNEAGVSQIRATSLAVLAFLVAVLAPVAGVIVPLWVLWRSGGVIVPSEQLSSRGHR